MPWRLGNISFNMLDAIPVTILFNEPPPPQLIGGEKQKTKCVDDKPTVAGSIVDRGGRFFRRPGCLYIYEGCGMRITDRGGH